jgi:DNA polymerase
MSMPVLSIDFETKAVVNLLDVDLYRYAADAGTDIWCMAWAFDDEEPTIWTPQQPLPQRIIDHILAGGEVRAWNAQFERIIWNNIMATRYMAPPLTLEQVVCSAAEAAAMALPRALGQCAAAVGVEMQKDEAGHRLMLQMTRPRRMEGKKAIWWDDADKTERLHAYCVQDVRTERALVKVLRRLSPEERRVYLLDQRINDRGVQMDRALVIACEDIARGGVALANAALLDVSGGEVKAVTNHADLRTWLGKQGVETTSVDKAAVRELLTQELPDPARRALAIRAEAGASSVAKLQKMLETASAGDRLRGMLMYHGAATGRWSGKGVQPQNFPRGSVDNAEQYIDLVMARDYATLDLMAPPVQVVSSLLRACMVAKDGHDLIAADYSAIEARVLAVLAGQNDIVELWRSGVDVYRHNATRLFGVTLEQVTKSQRQTGKFQELGCGYGMGHKKAVSAAKDVYGLILDPAEAEKIVVGYRETHMAVKQYWGDLDNAAIQAVAEPNRPVRLRDVTFVRAGGYLYLKLPSGRLLCYAAPKLVERAAPWGGSKTAVEISCVNSMTRQWERYAMYGGIWAENVVQAVSRDLMAVGMLALEARGYPVVLTVHDEVVSEIPTDFGSVEEFEQILETTPPWAQGWPVKAEGWRGPRYRK